MVFFCTSACGLNIKASKANKPTDTVPTLQAFHRHFATPTLWAYGCAGGHTPSKSGLSSFQDQEVVPTLFFRNGNSLFWAVVRGVSEAHSTSVAALPKKPASTLLVSFTQLAQELG